VTDGSSGNPNARVPTTTPRLWLFLVTALAFLLRLAESLVNPVNYDGYWHVFIARNLPREFASLAHPPLFPILLRLADAIRHSRLSYLSISLLAGAAAVFLFGLVLQKLSVDRATPLLGALALALSPSAILLSGVAESYMLCTAFLLAALLAYLELLEPRPGHSVSARIRFSAFATLALLSHYAAGLFLLAAVAVPLVLAAFEPRYRGALRRELPSRFAADAATFFAPVAVAAALFHFLARPWVRSLSHLPAFYRDSAHETAAAFLARTTAGTFNLFSPLRIFAPVAAAAALAAFVAAVVVIAVASDRRRHPAIPGAAPAAFLLLLLAIGMTTGLRGWYPFGGATRHQIFLMLFGLMAALVALDRILAACPLPARRALIALGVAAIAANAWGHLDKRWRPRPEPFAVERQRFDRDFPAPREVHVDQFNLVGFFAQHHDWQWDYLGAVAGPPGRERYRLSRDGRSLELVAHRDVWNMDLLNPDVYRALSSIRVSSASNPITLYCVHQDLPGQPPPASEKLEREIPALARAAGLETDKLDVVGGSVFAEFRRAGPAEPKP
jgi:hypothetical protein